MRLGQLVLRNSLHSPVRMLLTVVTVGILLTAFVFPRTLVDAQEQQIRDAPNNRILTRPRVGWGGAMPVRFGDEILAHAGVKQAVGMFWTNLYLPGKENLFFAAFAADPEPPIGMHHELVVPAEQKQAWLADERSLLVSMDLAQELGWQLGQRVLFQSRQFPGEWQYTVTCIYRAVGGAWAKRSLYVHYGSFNRALPVEAPVVRAYVTPAASGAGPGGGRAARPAQRPRPAARHGETVSHLMLQSSSDVSHYSTLQVRGVADNVFELRPQVHVIAGRALQPGTAEAIVGRGLAGRFVGLALGGELRARRRAPPPDRGRVREWRLRPRVRGLDRSGERPQRAPHG